MSVLWECSPSRSAVPFKGYASRAPRCYGEYAIPAPKKRAARTPTGKGGGGSMGAVPLKYKNIQN